MHLYWYVCTFHTGVYIDNFVHVVQSTNWLYLILGVLLYFILVFLFYISPLYWLFYHCVVVKYLFVSMCMWMLYIYIYICLLWYVFLLCTIYSSVVIHIEKLVMYISWFIVPPFPYLLICIHNSGLTPPCLCLPLICHIHWNTHIWS